MNQALIECRGVCKDYDMGGEVIHALRDVSLKINQGEYVAIMGPDEPHWCTGCAIKR